MHAAAGGVDQHGGGAVNHITRGNLFVTRLQEVFFGDRRTDRRDAAVDREDSPHGDVNVNVGGAIQRIHQHNVFGVFAPFEDHDFIFFFRGDTGDDITCAQCSF